MRIYMVDKISDKNSFSAREEILPAVKKAIQDFYRGFELKPALAMLASSECEFFLEAPDGLIMGKVFSGPLSLREFRDLCTDFSNLTSSMTEKVFLYAFFSGLEAGFDDELACETYEALQVQERVRCFEYFPMHAKEERSAALALKEWHPEKREKIVPAVSGTFSQAGVYPFFRPTRLHQEELSELLEISLLNGPS